MKSAENVIPLALLNKDIFSTHPGAQPVGIQLNPSLWIFAGTGTEQMRFITEADSGWLLGKDGRIGGRSVRLDGGANCRLGPVCKRRKRTKSNNVGLLLSVGSVCNGRTAYFFLIICAVGTKINSFFHNNSISIDQNFKI